MSEASLVNCKGGKEMYLIVSWWETSGKDAVVVSDEDGAARLFSTEEEAQEYYNTKLNGFYAIVKVEK